MNLSPSPIFTVSQITHAVKEVLENSLVPCWVEGEISNWMIHASGHCYFSLKDEQSQIRCVLWRSYRPALKFTPEEGLKVHAYGAVKVYERNGSYQLNVFTLRPAGMGELQLAFEQLKKKLAAEGLFDPARKRPLPTEVLSVGVVTSADGAAIHDIISIIKRRAPFVQIILRPVSVQGETAGEQIAKAIQEFNEYGEVDVLIVGRGGGSSEDLWTFNQETVVRAIALSRIPVISAVGHEIDYTLADFAADIRAATPSAAAELAVSDQAEKKKSLQLILQQFRYVSKFYFQSQREQFQNLFTVLKRLSPLDFIEQHMQQMDETQSKLSYLLKHHIQEKKGLFGSLTGKLEALSPFKTFARGYSITRKEQTGEILKTIHKTKLGEKLEILLWDGKIKSKVEQILEKESKKQLDA